MQKKKIKKMEKQLYITFELNTKIKTIVWVSFLILNTQKFNYRQWKIKKNVYTYFSCHVNFFFFNSVIYTHTNANTPAVWNWLKGIACSKKNNRKKKRPLQTILNRKITG
jgi:hypothetical protein